MTFQPFKAIESINSLPEAVFFDLDGTLVDTADDLGAALNHVLVRHGFTAKTPTEYRPVASHGAKGLLQLGFADAFDDFDFSVLRQQFLDYYQQHLTVHSRVFAGGLDFLAQLERAKIPWGIVTNKPYRLAAQMLREMPELHRCKLLLGGDSLLQRKPDPIPLLVAAHNFSVSRNQCWYIGDAERDIAAGRRAGMQTFIAEFGYIDKSDQIEQWQSDYLLRNFDQLTRVVSKLIK